MSRHRGTIGEIKKSSPIRFYWKIPTLTSLSGSVGDYYSSPEIQHFDNVWRLRIYPRGIESFPGYVSLQVFRQFTYLKPVRFSFGIFKNDCSDEYFIHNQTFNAENHHYSELFPFMPVTDLLRRWSELAISDELHIIFKIWMDGSTVMEGKELVVSPDTQTEDVAEGGVTEETHEHLDTKDGDDPTLRQHLEDMLLSGDDHDVTIKVKQQKFRAHKCMLRARSPVFAAMFKHEMKESADDSISIEDCDPESFGEFLQYVYTGKVKNLSLSNAMGLYYAGDKYDFSGLKKLCLEFLKASLSVAAITDVITLAIKHSEAELLECAMAFVAKHLEEIMSSVEWQRFVLDNPLRANEICLKAFKCRSLEN